MQEVCETVFLLSSYPTHSAPNTLTCKQDLWGAGTRYVLNFENTSKNYEKNL